MTTEPTAATTPAPTIIVTSSNGPGMGVRIAWFIFIGWWLSGLAMTLGYLLMLTVVLIPLGYAILNMIPVLQTLRSRSQHVSVASVDGVTNVHAGTRPQMSFGLRALYFVCVGWWLVGIWMAIGWVLGATVVLLPLSVMMFNRIPEVMTLRRD